ncbi:MAG: SPFH domain-containing protein, partial [Anaeromyxobacteraceae bacterium]|nr:SPFH domain-containing protein [Anaeromyxobacteraceae bacterium]
MFRVQKLPITKIPGGKIGLVEATDGARIPEGRLLAARIDGHSSFFDGEAFIRNGVHDNFQNADAFLQAGGQKGLQIPVLRAGNYAINPWFATIDLVDMIQVQIGSCGVVTSYVGGEGADLTDDAVNAKIVANGSKGIWAEPLQPGKHPLNTKICKVDLVPTTQILLNWADTRSSAHELDSSLKTITLRTADAFNVNMDVSVIIHIPVKNAPKVIANLGSVKNMISQVLEPAISSHFRNAAQYIKALDLYTQRRQLQEKAKEHIDAVLRVHHIDSKDTLIADVVLPQELTKTVTDRQIAEQEKKTFATQKEAQDERRSLENAKAQAN